MPPAEPGETAPDLPRGRVLASPPENGGDSGAPWRRMDHGPFLFHALSITDGEGEAILEIERALVVRLDPGIGGVTRGRVRAIYDVGKFRFLGIARGGNFSDETAIFDGNGPPRLTLAGATFQAAEEPEGDAGAAEFKGVRVSGRDVIVLSSLHGVDFAERFVWKEDQGPERVYGPLENDAASGKPAPADLVESVTRVVAEEAESGVPLMIEAIPAPAPDEIITASWMRFTGLAARGDGTAFLCTPNGEVWMVRGLDGADPALRWRRFASGLDTPHQLAITGGVLAARCRGGWFRLIDRDNDGFCEFYEPEPAPERDAVALRTDQLARFAAPARTGDNTWYFAVAATETSPGAGLIRSQGGPPSEADPPVYVWLPGAESSPPAGPVWLPATSKWGGGFQGGTLWPCRDSGGVFRLWSARPGDLSMPRVLWSLPVPPLETDITGSSFAGSSLYFCGLPLDEETPAHTTSFWRLRRLKGHLFHPVEFDADDQSVTLRFNAPLDAAATAASRFVRVTGWKPDAGLSEAKPISPRRVLLGRNTLRVVSDVIEAGAGFTLECAVTDIQGLSHRFTVHFTLPDVLPPAVLPAPRSRPMPPPVAAGEDGETPPPQDPVDNPLLDDGPAFEWPGRLPELDDPVEEEEPLPRR